MSYIFLRSTLGEAKIFKPVVSNTSSAVPMRLDYKQEGTSDIKRGGGKRGVEDAKKPLFKR